MLVREETVMRENRLEETVVVVVDVVAPARFRGSGGRFVYVGGMAMDPYHEVSTGCVRPLRGSR